METAKTQSQSPDQLVERLRGIVAFLPSFKVSGFKFGHWTQPSSDQLGVMMLPYFSLSEVAASFEQAAYDLGWIMHDFNWGTWKQTPEAMSLRDDPRALEQATPEQLARLLTTCIRQDRFCEGALEAAFASGLLTRILERAAAILREADEPGASVVHERTSEPEKDQSISRAKASAESARVLGNYYTEFSGKMPLVCPNCHWIGAAKDGATEEYKDLFDVSCPKCSKMLLVVPFPTEEQAKEAAAAGNVEAMRVLPLLVRREALWERLERTKLKFPEQLPDVPEDEINLVWDTENAGEEDASVVIKAKDRVLWREPLLYECWPRFNEVEAILKQKYGQSCRSLTPTDRSHMWLFGDSLTASDKVSFTFDDVLR